MNKGTGTAALVLFLFFIFFNSGSKAANKAAMAAGTPPELESMNGTAERMAGAEWNLRPRDDADTNEAANHRSWYYVKLENVDKDSVTVINVYGDGWNGVRFAPPVYSYDKKTWHSFEYSEITRLLRDKSGKRPFYKYRITKKFAKPNVWIARYYPYTYTMLKDFVSSIRKEKKIRIDTIGTSPGGQPIFMLTVTDFSKPDSAKKRIWIHARTHPAESGSSFVVEGLIRYLLSAGNKADLSKLIFNIVPMVNPDGVIVGNSRLSGEGVNLEEAWERDEKNDSVVSDKAPAEVKALNKAVGDLIAKGQEIIAAVNLHTLNPLSYLKPYPFAFSNFSNWDKYGSEGKSLWIKQTTFVKFLNEEYCTPISMRKNAKTTSTLDKKKFPESWWWVNFRDRVMAITIEASPEKTCCGQACLSYEAHYRLGESIVLALQKYYNFARRFDFASAPSDTDLDELFQYWEGVDMEEQSNGK